MGQTIGIDFGTTTTEVSYVKDGCVHSMKLDGGNYYIPTIICFNSEDDYIIGEEADILSRNLENVRAVIRNFKLDLTDKAQSYQIVARDGSEFVKKPQHIVQLFLNKILNIVQPQLFSIFGIDDGKIDKAVITVPAQFNPVEKENIKMAIRKAAVSAGFEDIKVVAEPTAAAVAFSDIENLEVGQTVLVYDFGGGTFDVSIIKKEHDRFMEIETDGDKTLGGNLLTEKIAEYLWEECLERFGIPYLPFKKEDIEDFDEEEYDLDISKLLRNRAEIISTAENMKRKFLKKDVVGEAVNFYCPGGEEKAEWLELTLDRFEQIIDESIDKTIDITKRVIERTEEKVDHLVLAGGSSQIRLIKKKMKQHLMLDDLKFDEDEDLQTLISRGAAILADSQLATEEKTRFELGICERVGASFNTFVPIISAGVKLPCSGKRVYPIENRNSIKIIYCEKDSKKYPNASSVYDDGIEEVSKMEIDLPDAGNAVSVEVVFHMEKDGTPSVNANILDAGGNVIITDKIEVKRGELI